MKCSPVSVRKWPKALDEVLKSPVTLARAIGYDRMLDELHGEAWDYVKDESRSYIEIPRKHFKSTLFAICCPLYDQITSFCWDRCMIFSNTLDLVEDAIEKIYEHIQGNIVINGERMRFLDVFPWMEVGRGRNTGFSKKKGIVFKNKQGPFKERNIYPHALGVAGAGKRATKIYADDLSNEQNCRTQGRRENVVYGYETLTPYLFDLEMPIRVIGTPWHLFDISKHLKEVLGVKTYRRTVWDGVSPETGLKDGLGPGPEGAWPLASSIMDAEDIGWLTDPKNDKSISEYLFAAWYLLDPVAGKDSIFKKGDWDAAIDRDCTLDRILSLGHEIALVDPSFVSGGRCSNSGITIYRVIRAMDLGIGEFFPKPESNVFVPVMAMDLSGDWECLVDTIQDLARDRGKNGLRAVLLENAASYKEIIKYCPRLANGVEFSVLPQRSSAGNGKPLRALNFRNAMVKGRVRIPPDFPGYEDLHDQVTGYGSLDHDDLFDSAAFVSMLPMVGRSDAVEPTPPPPGSIAESNLMIAAKQGHSGRSWTGI